jgi:hypothetical protein
MVADSHACQHGGFGIVGILDAFLPIELRAIALQIRRGQEGAKATEAVVVSSSAWARSSEVRLAP